MNIKTITIVSENGEELSFNLYQQTSISQWAGSKELPDFDGTGMIHREHNKVKTFVLISGPSPLVDECMKLVTLFMEEHIDS